MVTQTYCAESSDQTLPSLLAILQQIPDLRQAQGKRHPLAAMFGAACAAMLCGYHSPYAIADWLQNYGTAYLKRFGFTQKRAPGQATWYRVFGQINHAALETRLANWAQRG